MAMWPLIREHLGRVLLLVAVLGLATGWMHFLAGRCARILSR